MAEHHKTVQTFEHEHKLQWGVGETIEGEVTEGTGAMTLDQPKPLATIASKEITQETISGLFAKAGKG